MTTHWIDSDQLWLPFKTHDVGYENVIKQWNLSKQNKKPNYN